MQHLASAAPRLLMSRRTLMQRPAYCLAQPLQSCQSVSEQQQHQQQCRLQHCPPQLLRPRPPLLTQRVQRLALASLPPNLSLSLRLKQPPGRHSRARASSRHPQPQHQRQPPHVRQQRQQQERKPSEPRLAQRQSQLSEQQKQWYRPAEPSRTPRTARQQPR